MPTENDNTPQEPVEAGTPQGKTKRFPWSKEKVQHKPTRRNRRDFEKLVKQGVYPS